MTTTGEPALRNAVPILDRAMEALSLLERVPDGASIRQISLELGVPRSTVYRMLNTLLAHKLVRRSDTGVFTLGPRLVALAARVRAEGSNYDLADIATPPMRGLRDELGEPVKLSVRDGDRARVIVALLGRDDDGPAPSTGTSYPLHAGAASKLILAYLPGEELDRLLSGPLTRYTPRTITEPDRLRADLVRIRRQGFAFDQGEHNLTVHAMAAPVLDPSGHFLAALSIPFLADKPDAARERMRQGLLGTALEISTRIPRG